MIFNRLGTVVVLVAVACLASSCSKDKDKGSSCQGNSSINLQFEQMYDVAVDSMDQPDFSHFVSGGAATQSITGEVVLDSGEVIPIPEEDLKGEEFPLESLTDFTLSGDQKQITLFSEGESAEMGMKPVEVELRSKLYTALYLPSEIDLPAADKAKLNNEIQAALGKVDGVTACGTNSGLFLMSGHSVKHQKSLVMEVKVRTHIQQ